MPDVSDAVPLASDERDPEISVSKVPIPEHDAPTLLDLYGSR